ncbi:hypothetical protein V1525DRAFT_393996 [Lipomyces kononenkoae]|uniref:Uncharacterized protein n=1 Tax=Lipomyces kononenkoae TaxID=34357 RepID=A0ACC3TAV5_LIPKO
MRNYIQSHSSDKAAAEGAPEVVFNQNGPEAGVVAAALPSLIRSHPGIHMRNDMLNHLSNKAEENAAEVVFDQNSAEASVAATAMEKVIIPESEHLLDIRSNKIFGKGNARDEEQLCGLSRRMFYIMIVAIMLVVGVAIGAGLGVGLKVKHLHTSFQSSRANNSKHKPSSTYTSTSVPNPKPSPTYTSTSVPDASISISSVSATATPSTIASTFCIPSSNIVVNPHFENLSDWILDGNGSYTVNFEQIFWNDSSPAGVYLPILEPGQTQVNGDLGGIHQNVNLPANSIFAIRTSFQIVLRQDVYPSGPYFTFYVIFFDYSYQLQQNITIWYNTTFDGNVNGTTYTIHRTFETFSDSDLRFYFYGLSNFADLYVHTASIYNVSDNSCPSDDNGRSIAFLEST